MSVDTYRLDENGEAVACTLAEWALWFEHNRTKRHVGLDRFDGIKVSTVFLGLDHNFYESGPPVLWETMIFGGKYDDYQMRYTSKEEALQGHELARQLALSQPWLSRKWDQFLCWAGPIADRLTLINLAATLASFKQKNS